MTARRQAWVWVGSRPERSTWFHFSTYDDLRSKLNAFCDGKDTQRKFFTVRETKDMLTPESPLDADRVEIVVNTMLQGEHVIAFGAVHDN